MTFWNFSIGSEFSILFLLLMNNIQLPMYTLFYLFMYLLMEFLDVSKFKLFFKIYLYFL